MVMVRKAHGPAYEDLRPMQDRLGAATGPTFPVYPGLAKLLLHPSTEQVEARPDDVAAHAMSVLSTYAYSDLASLMEMATRLGFEKARGLEVRFVNDPLFISSTAYLLQSEDGTVAILVYRGTEPVNAISWLTDLDATPERVTLAGQFTEQFDVHAGFYRNVRATRFRIAEALRAALDRQPIIEPTAEGVSEESLHKLQALYIAGHSLGGALAALMGILLRQDKTYWTELGPVLKGIYTFGQPMVGSPDLASHYDTDEIGRRTYRFIYEGDPVPRLPSHDTGSWGHFGHEFHYLTRLTSQGWNLSRRRVGQMRFIGQTLTAFGSFPLSQLLVLNRIPFQYRIDDHRPHHYVAQLTPAGTVTEFGDHEYLVEPGLWERLSREIEQDLRQLFEVPARAGTGIAQAFVAATSALRE
jgi:hypothetical protein